MVILGLGSNTGDRLGYLTSAVRELKRVLRGVRLSRILESKALLPPGAPDDWGHSFLNMAVSGATSLTPEALFAEIKAIEQRLGRKPRGVWAPREIDIDILAMDDRVVESAVLTIPHRELLNRDFALLPLIDLVPDWLYPVAGKYYQWKAVDIARDKKFALNADLKDTGMILDAAA
jgi:2-amino-4-hydroxy-6-hydroxymethyldihydropteridine diphosphokinase / dihydropteroate synthase